MQKKLYHFTARERLAFIMREGLLLGDVPTWSLFDVGEPAVWLTTDPRPSEQGLDFVREFTDYDRFSGLSMEDVITMRGSVPDKTGVRITVTGLPERKLMRWSEWALDRVEPDIYAALESHGGAKHLSWYVYWDVIPPDCFEVVELRGAGDRYAPGKVIHAQHRWPRRLAAA